MSNNSARGARGTGGGGVERIGVQGPFDSYYPDGDQLKICDTLFQI